MGAAFFQALQEGHRDLLNEMDLLPHAAPKGLNNVLNNRGIVSFPELGLGRSFVRQPCFLAFATQNSLQQGGGRQGLPKFVLNRFTTVYVQKLSLDDLILVYQHYHNHLTEQLQCMIAFNP